LVNFRFVPIHEKVIGLFFTGIFFPPFLESKVNFRWLQEVQRMPARHHQEHFGRILARS